MDHAFVPHKPDNKRSNQKDRSRGRDEPRALLAKDKLNTKKKG